MLDLTPTEAVRALEPYAGEFLYTHVDREGLMQGTDMGAIEAVRNATTRRLTAAGGITTMDEVEFLDAMGVDAVVGMAIYTGRMSLPASPRRERTRRRIEYSAARCGSRTVRLSLLLASIAVTALCRMFAAAGTFLEPNARAHIGMLAGTIGSRPIGTPANATSPRVHHRPAAALRVRRPRPGGRCPAGLGRAHGARLQHHRGAARTTNRSDRARLALRLGARGARSGR